MKAVNHRQAAGVVAWSCPSNIAIVKYWGKKPGQIPMNPSLSMTLQKALTKTRVEYTHDSKIHHPEIKFRFEGKEATAFEQRIATFIESLSSLLPFLAHTNLVILSSNTFPHSSGIASSASAFGALAMCLVSLEETLGEPPEPSRRFIRASTIARLGSGSASRSIYPGFALWGASGDWPGSSDEYAIPVSGFNETFKGVVDSILIVESGQKIVSSSKGHKSMETNPFAQVRFQQARSNLLVLQRVLQEGDWKGFIDLLEEEALSLHAMMLTGKPGYLLMLPGTISILNRVRRFREDTGTRLGFTLDAGANVHLLYAADDAPVVKEFIDMELLQFCENKQVLHDSMGEGPVNLTS
ncbi:MAG: diphosphomevalonate decarboxylase [Bacteroidota bacterium]